MKSYNFINQLSEYDCGPTAIFNACQRYGIDVDYKDIILLSDTEKYGCTHNTKLEWVINLFLKPKVKIYPREKTTLEEFKMFIHSGHSAIISYITDETEWNDTSDPVCGHCVFLYSENDRVFIYNETIDELVNIIEHDQIDDYFSENFFSYVVADCPKAWYLKQK